MDPIILRMHLGLKGAAKPLTAGHEKGAWDALIETYLFYFQSK